jgi:hypothetical protein
MAERQMETVRSMTSKMYSTCGASIGAAHSQGLDPAEQERVRAMFAARSDRSATATVEIRQELKKEG